MSSTANGNATGTFRFSKFTCPAGGGYHLYDAATTTYTNLFVQDCEFWSGANDFSGTSAASTVTLRNNLFWRSTLYASNTSALTSLEMTNNLVWGSAAVTLCQPDGGLWSAFDNDFDSSTISSTSLLTNGYNAYLNCSGRLYPTNVHDIVQTNTLSYQSNWLGSFYQPAGSALINVGNTTADQVGLYHYTVTTNDVVEGTNTVSIGYHYVAVDQYGNPVDSNGDGIPDYLEDANGNGLVDSGETPWCLAILTQPTNLLVNQGNNGNFSVTAGGVAPLSYQWYFNSARLPGATNATLTLNNVQTNSAGTYYVVVSNSLYSLTSSNGTLAVVAPPTVLITNPVNNAVFIANQTNITVTATASDVAGSISQVQFFQGTTNLGILTNSPYTIVWSNAPAGNYALTAVAVDNGLSATSPVVNITVSSLFATNSLSLWLRADAGVTNNGAGQISSWADQSGGTNSATQSTISNQPQYVTNAINGYPVVRFLGTNYFNLPYFMNGTTGAEALVVLKMAIDPPSTWQSLWSLGVLNHLANGAEAYTGTDGSIYETFGTASGFKLGVPSQLLTQYHVYEVSAQTNNWIAWINGIKLYQTVSNAYSINGSTPSPQLGAVVGFPPDQGLWSTYFNGDIAEVLIFNRPLAAGERTTLNTYLNGKYALVSAAAATPSNLVATAISPTQVSLAWEEPLSGGATQISIERSTSSNGLFTAAVQAANTLSIIDTNLTPGTTYYYRARAINLATWSNYSNETNATTPVMGSDIPLSNLALWLKADAGLLQGSTNTLVNCWADQSGHGNVALQTIPTNNPVWVPGVMGDRPVVRFNGTNSYFYLPGNAHNAGPLGSLLNGSNSAEAFVVLKVVTQQPSAPQSLWYFGLFNKAAAFYPNTNGAILETFGSDTTSAFDLGVPSQPLTQYHLYEVSAQTTNLEAWINGILLYQTTGNNFAFNTYAPQLGGAFSNFGDPIYHQYYFAGDVAELLMFNRPLTVDERDAVGGYLSSKYGLLQYATNAVAPSAPTNLLATGIAPYELEFQWMSTSTNASSFHLERELGTNGPYQEISGLPFGISNCLDSTAIPTNAYFYRVRAHNLFGDAYSAVISPPTVSLTNWLATALQNATNQVSAQAADADGTVSNVKLFANNAFASTVSSAPYAFNWVPPFSTTYSLAALATDNQGNSQFSAPITVTVYLDSNGDGIPDYLQVLQGNDPINPWVPPSGDSDTNPPNINLIVPANATLQQ